MPGKHDGEIDDRYRVTFHVVDDLGERVSETRRTNVVLTAGYSVFEDLRQILGIKYGRRGPDGKYHRSIRVETLLLVDV